MPKPFDATTKHLLEAYPDSWLALIGQGPGLPVQVINAELSTITSEADKVLRVGGDAPWLTHFELQARRDPILPRRMLRYNVLLDLRHDLPVRSVAVLLRPSVDDPGLSGNWERGLPGEAPYLGFQFQVVRIWREPVEPLLAGGLGTLPLVPLADVSREALPHVLRRVGDRLRGETNVAEAANLWAATSVLMGLRYEPGFTKPLIAGVRAMIFGIDGIEESSTYQAILAEGVARGITQGRIESVRRIILKLGRRRLGEPSAEVVATIDAIDDPERLERLLDRLQEVPSWDELISNP